MNIMVVVVMKMTRMKIMIIMTVMMMMVTIQGIIKIMTKFTLLTTTTGKTRIAWNSPGFTPLVVAMVT